ncbi:hypothetical protein WJX72_010385 [[Myrmecia] bisecta]|uniref:Asn/Gln amidotransferase domain-containing protein n=1 Tax=[Myrmecia] bisecta TaxID=41462 RepID=A0AAW1QT61_9CHLO
MQEAKIPMDKLPMRPHTLADMLKLIEDGAISEMIGKQILPDLLEGKGSEGVKKFCESKGLVQIVGATLKSAVGATANLDSSIVGTFNATGAFSTLNVGQDIVGQDIPGNDISLCAATPGCQAFVFVDADPANAAAAPAGNCFLKTAAPATAPYSQLTSGKLNGNNAAPTYSPPVQVLSHSEDEQDTQAVPLEGFFLPNGNQDPNIPGSALLTPAHINRIYLLSTFQYSNIKQVDWYIHRPGTNFTDPANPLVPSQKTATAAPYYLGSTANAAGGQGTTWDIQNFRSDGVQACGSPANGSKCTATIVVTLNDGTKLIGAPNTFLVAVNQGF